jgi:hypothetical protein
MYYDAEKLVNFCAEKKITTEQFFLCWTTYHHKFELLYKYVNEVREIPEALIKDLELKGHVINMNKPGESYPDNFIVCDSIAGEFEKLFSSQESDEIFDNFPTTVYLPDGTSFLGRNMSRPDVEKFYKQIRFKGIDHKKVLNSLKAQKDSGSLGMGLRKWLETEQWDREDNTRLDLTDDL